MRELDREETANYTLTLLATDGLHNSTAQLLIKVEDVNDNSPQCEQVKINNLILNSFLCQQNV